MSKAERDLLAGANIPAERFEVITLHQSPALVVPGSERSEQAVFVGRLDPVKGSTCCSRLGRARCAWPLAVIGDGPERARLEQLAAELGIADRVTFHGLLPHAQAMEVLARARLLCVPSVWPETFGIAIIEAYARGVPVLASRIGAPAELVDPASTGALVEASDVVAWAAAIATMVADGDALARMSRAAAERRENAFTRRIALQRLEDIYAGAQTTAGRRGGAGR